MSDRPALPRGPFLLVGLARSGVAAARALRARGEEVIGVDIGSPSLAGEDFEQHLRTDGVEQLARARAVVKSPGVPAAAPAILAARERGVPVLGELELAWRMLPQDWIAVTGTNGKTTTVELIGAIHREAGLPVHVAGNVGRALSGLIGSAQEQATIVCEASSFQLEDTLEFAPDAAVLLNLAPDHLDRHGTLAAYRAAKLRIFARQGSGATAVAPAGFGEFGGAAERIDFGSAATAAMADRDGRLWWRGEPLLAADEVRLRGLHNRQNAMAAAAVCLARGIAADAVCEALRSFAGVPHRLEEVARRDGVLWINDSKATNVASALVALESFAAGSVHLILGGEGKGQDFTPLAAAVRARCAGVYLIGRDASLIEAALGFPTARRCGDLEHAVQAARAAARPGQCVLLSPACASFDQFEDFEARGERFRVLAG
ncbi:MAG: UDP-N-acetylmuramoyl-L-alanine--D-glutamate ligase [Solirubrobacteraceae bacterium]